jgi:hypothetical protein
MHHGNINTEGALRGADNAQGEDKGNNANAARKHCQREPTHNGRDRGGGQHNKRQQRMTTDDDNVQSMMTMEGWALGWVQGIVQGRAEGRALGLVQLWAQVRVEVMVQGWT